MLKMLLKFLKYLIKQIWLKKSHSIYIYGMIKHNIKEKLELID